MHIPHARMLRALAAALGSTEGGIRERERYFANTSDAARRHACDTTECGGCEDSSELMCLRPVPAQPRPPFSEARTECPGGGGPASAPPEPASGASASPTSLSSEGCSGGEPSGGDPSGTEPSSGGSSGAHGASEEGSSRCAAERRLRAREERHEYSAAGSICGTASSSTCRGARHGRVSRGGQGEVGARRLPPRRWSGRRP